MLGRLLGRLEPVEDGTARVAHQRMTAPRAGICLCHDVKGVQMPGGRVNVCRAGK